MNDKIIKIYTSLKTRNKDNVRITLCKKYKRSIDGIRMHWLLKGMPPFKYQAEVLEILENELKNQIERDKEILEK